MFSTVSALAHGEVRLAAWSLSALATSALALWLLHCRRDMYLRSSLRDWLYAGMRLHRAYAIVGMRRWVGGRVGKCIRLKRSAAQRVQSIACPVMQGVNSLRSTLEQNIVAGLQASARAAHRSTYHCPNRGSLAPGNCIPPHPSHPSTCRGLTPPPAPPGITGPGPAAGDRVYFAKAVLVSSSILPILLQSLVLQLQLPLQAAVQVRQGGQGRAGVMVLEGVPRPW